MRQTNTLDQNIQDKKKIQTINKLLTDDLKVIYKQRSSKRLPYNNKIEIIANSREFITGIIINISHNGLCITSDSDIPVGTQISARIFLGSEICELEGSIRWSSKILKDESFKIGVELVELPDDLVEIYKTIYKKFAAPEKNKRSEKDYTQILREL